MVSEQKKSISKKELRLRFKEASAEYLRTPAVNLAIVENLKKILPLDCIIGAYQARPDEPGLEALLEESRYRFAFPRIVSDQIEYLLPESKEAFELNEFSIFEPKPSMSEKVDIHSMRAVLVPAVAFDRKLSRLGRGKGFYDRFLAQYRGLKIGVCSVVQIANLDLPTDPHDIAMDIVVTDQFLLRRFDA